MTRILLVEDDADLRETLREDLERAGYEVLTADGGHPGLAILERTAVDAAVTDIVMANGEGIEFIRKLKAARPDLPVIAMSAKAQYLRHAAQLGADRTLQKPFRFNDLLAVLPAAA